MEIMKVMRSSLQGTIHIPPSKSHTLRAILFASLAEGESKLFNCLSSPDTNAMIEACRAIGAIIYQQADYIQIQGVAGKPQSPTSPIDAGNSGQVLRFIGAILGLTEGCTTITGDHSIQTNRPAQPLLDGLNQLGAQAISRNQNGYAPLIIKGKMKAGKAIIAGEDSQPVSALIIAACFLKGITEIQVMNAGEKPWVHLTLSWLDRLHIQYENDHFNRYLIHGNNTYQGFEYTVPSDMTSATYPIAAAIITHSDITLENIDLDDAQGDKKFITLLVQMGANIQYDKTTQNLYVQGSHSHLLGRRVDVNDMIDTITLWAVIGCFVEGELKITGGAIARKKECDRITSICSELKKMGADIKEKADGMIVKPSPLKGTTVNSFNDHRIVLSLAVAAMNADGITTITHPSCIKKSFPEFVDEMRKALAYINTYADPSSDFHKNANHQTEHS